MLRVGRAISDIRAEGLPIISLAIRLRSSGLCRHETLFIWRLAFRGLLLPSPRQDFESFSRRFEHRGNTEGGLGAFQDDVDVLGIKLDPKTAAADAARGDKRGSRAEERIKHETDQ